VTTSLPPKELVCDCGNKFISQQRSNWCRSCGKQIFYDARDARKNRYNRIYVILALVIFIGFTAYFFIEMVLTPILTMQQP
jgi:DNA-directed RNA polymerase subunit RPC12/RpoP